VLNRIAQAHRAGGPAQIALAWLLRRSPIMLPIPGTSSIEHLEQNVAAASLSLTEEEYQQLSGVPSWWDRGGNLTPAGNSFEVSLG